MGRARLLLLLGVMGALIGTVSFVTLERSSSQSTPSVTLNLVQGWNNVAYPGASLPVAQALSPIAGKYSVVYYWDAATARWLGYNPAAPDYANDLQQVVQYGAYWINMNEPAAFTVALALPPVPVPPPGSSLFSTQKVTTQGSPGFFAVRGEIVNGTGSNALWPAVFATALDANGNILDARWAYAYRDLVPKGEAAPFEVQLSPPSQPSRYSLQVAWGKTQNPAVTALAITAPSSPYRKQQYLCINARISNNSDSSYRNVKIAGSMYDAAGNVVVAAVGIADVGPDGIFSPAESVLVETCGYAAPDLNPSAVVNSRLWPDGQIVQ